MKAKCKKCQAEIVSSLIPRDEEEGFRFLGQLLVEHLANYHKQALVGIEQLSRQLVGFLVLKQFESEDLKYQGRVKEASRAFLGIIGECPPEEAEVEGAEGRAGEA